MPDLRPDVGAGCETAQAPAEPTACPGCAHRDDQIALRDHQIDLLVRSRGAAIETAFQSAARARAAEAELGRLAAGGRAIPGLAELARAEAG